MNDSELPHAWHREVDVVAVGYGAAALATAIVGLGAGCGAKVVERTGADRDFGLGTIWFEGMACGGPGPAHRTGAVSEPPFSAMPVFSGLLETALGLVTDGWGRGGDFDRAAMPDCLPPEILPLPLVPRPPADARRVDRGSPSAIWGGKDLGTLTDAVRAADKKVGTAS